MKNIKPTLTIDCINENCPMPLIRTREAVMKAKNGDIIKIVGTHPDSYVEIPMALDALGIKIIKQSKNSDKWYITFKV